MLPADFIITDYPPYLKSGNERGVPGNSFRRAKKEDAEGRHFVRKLPPFGFL
jgi:hypothetical protein